LERKENFVSKNPVSYSRFTSGYPQKKIFANSFCGENYRSPEPGAAINR